MPTGRQYPQWLQELFNKYTPGELSRGVVMEKPRKVRGEIQMRPYRVKGVDLSPRTLRRIRNREGRGYTTSQINKLRRLHYRLSYHRLRNAGASIEQAKKYSTDIGNTDKEYLKMMRKLARDKGVPLAYILYGARRCDMSKNTWEEYVQKRPWKRDNYKGWHTWNNRGRPAYRREPSGRRVPTYETAKAR